MNQPQDDPDFLLCLDYLRYVEFESHSQKEFAAKHNTTDVTVFRWRQAWTARGLLSSCREFMGIDMNEDIKVAERQLVRQWQSASKELMNLALNAKREDVRLGAIQEFWREHVKPFVNEQPDPGTHTRDYLEFIGASPMALDPMSILRDDLANYEPRNQEADGDPESDTAAPVVESSVSAHTTPSIITDPAE